MDDRFYLIYGTEEVLKKQSAKKYIKAYTDESDEMNYSHFDNDNADILELQSVSETAPFFAEWRVIYVKNSGWFSKANDYSEILAHAPETTRFVFVEKEVDKRNKLYKFFNENGKVEEISAPDEQTLRNMVIKTLNKKGFNIESAVANLFITRVGLDMSKIQVELDKLTAYCDGQDTITAKDIETISSETPDSKVFTMIDAMMVGDVTKAVELYNGLLANHENPVGILSLLTKTYDKFYQVCALSDKNYNKSQIAKITGTMDFLIDKYVRMGRKYGTKKLRLMFEYGIELEHKIKRGDMNDRIAVEMFIIYNSTN